MEKVAREAGRFIVEERRKLTRDDVETKSQASFVTYVDKRW